MSISYFFTVFINIFFLALHTAATQELMDVNQTVVETWTETIVANVTDVSSSYMYSACISI